MYDLHSPFDIQKHKENYTNYLEVVIFPDGHIEYAIPSHQEKLIKICTEQLGITRHELEQMCPREYYCDYITWLCTKSNCVSVWNTYIMKSDIVPITQEQRNAIKQLQDADLLQL